MADQFRTDSMDWEDVRFFLALARQGNLSAAARALAVNHATVARRLAALEKTLGAKLFNRRPTGYELTDVGRSALEAADSMEAAAAALARLEPTATLSGLVRITAISSLAEAYLVPRLPALQEQHPGLDVEIVAERRLVSLQRYQSDIALRLGRPERGELLGRRIVNIAYRFYAAPPWRDRVHQGDAPCFIGFDEAGAQLPEALWLARRFGRTRFAVRCNNQSGQMAAARAGCGIAMLPCFLAFGDPGLVEVSLSEMPPARELWLLTRSGAGRTPRIHAVTNFLLQLIQRDRLLFQGSGIGI